MPNKTINYNLVKPLETEYYDINIPNSNMDIIDTEIKKVSDAANKKIDDLENKINDNELKSFETDVLMTPLKDCNGGFVSTKLYGRTLVNLLKDSGKGPFVVSKATGGSRLHYFTSVTPLKAGVDYTLIFNVSKIEASLYVYAIYPQVEYLNVSVGSLGLNVVNIKFKDTNPNTIGIYMSADYYNLDKNAEFSDVMLFETSTLKGYVPNTYFEGMRHVGEALTLEDGKKAYRIENLTKSKNLVEASKMVTYEPYSSIKVENDIITLTFNGTSKTLTVAKNGFIPSNAQYTISGYMKLNGKPVNRQFWLTDRANTYNSPKASTFKVDETTGFFEISEVYTGVYRFFIHASCEVKANDVVTIEKLQFELGDKATTYESYKEDKTEILSPQPLSQYDSVDMEGVIHLSSYSETFDGSEPGWTIYSDKKNTFTIKLRNVSKEGICDKYNTINNTDFDKKTGFYAASSASLIICDMTCSSLADFKAKLQSNPITVTYQQCDNNFKIIYREINTNKTLISKGYPNGMLQINAGPVQPHVKGSYATNMGERATSMENAIGELQNDVQDLQASTLVLAGEVINAKQGIQKLNTDIDQKINSTIEDLNKQIAEMKNSIWVRKKV